MKKPSRRRVELDTGLGYHALEWDGGGDHTVILVHGFLDLAWGWQPTVSAGLADGFHVIAPDMRGHGDSDRVGPGSYYHFMDYVADLAAFIDAVGRARVSLVGHSMGGSITSYYTGTFPGRVHKLAVLEGLGPPEDGLNMPERLSQWLRTWQRARNTAPTSYSSRQAAAERLRKHDSLLTEDASLRLAEHGTREIDGGFEFKHDPIHLTRGPYPFRVELAEQLWRNITCPVLAVDGSESKFRLAQDDADRRYAALANLERRTLTGAGHMMHRHRPEELARLLREFLED